MYVLVPVQCLGLLHYTVLICHGTRLTAVQHDLNRHAVSNRIARLWQFRALHAFVLFVLVVLFRALAIHQLSAWAEDVDAPPWPLPL